MRVLLAMLLTLLGAIGPGKLAAQERALHWDRYDVDVQVLENGDLRMTETQVIVVDQGTFRTGSRSFDTGEFGRVRNVEVREDGEPYRRGTNQAGTFTASDDGQRFTLNYVFRDASAARHSMTIAYTVGRAIVASGEQAHLEWNFLCAAEGCPPIEASTLTVRLPRGVAQTAISANASGAPMRQTQNSATLQWELIEPVQGQQVRLAIDFPRSSLAPDALFRPDSLLAPQEEPLSTQPDAPQAPLPAPGLAAPPAGISPLFCLMMIVFLFIAFSIMRGSMRRQGYAPARRPRSSPFGGMGRPPMGFPPMGRRRRSGGGWGIPPIIIPPTFGPRDGGGSFGSPDRSGGGGSSWGDSGGGGSSWGDSGGGSSSWGDSGGGGSSWGDSGGGGGSSGGGGGGSNDSSSFG